MFATISDKLKTYLHSLNSSSPDSFDNSNYYSVDEFREKIQKDYRNSENISIFHLNIRSLNANHAKLFELLTLLDFKFDVIVLSEVWSFNITMYATLFKDYNFYYNLPKFSSIGGIGIYVHK